MKRFDNNIEAFLTLVRSGLWNKGIRLSECGKLDFSKIYKLAEEQSVVGVVSAGIELVEDIKVPQEILLNFVGSTLQIEQRNKDMNKFVACLMRRLRQEGIFSILLKGQGVAQCYEHPLWRSSGDVDLLMDEENYTKAKKFLCRYGVVESEDVRKLHLAMLVDSWLVELHGNMPFDLSKRVDRVVDEVLSEIYRHGAVRVWKNDETDVPLPKADNDLIVVFTHFLHHFFIEGVGLRQISDWCRLLWTFRKEIDKNLLEKRLKRMGLMAEWKVFAAMTVEYLGMPEDVMPFYDPKFKAKGTLVLLRLLRSGNFGKNNDLSYRSLYVGMRYNIVSFWRRFIDFFSLIPVFPVDAMRFFFTYVTNRAKQQPN